MTPCRGGHDVTACHLSCIVKNHLHRVFLKESCCALPRTRRYWASRPERHQAMSEVAGVIWEEAAEPEEVMQQVWVIASPASERLGGIVDSVFQTIVESVFAASGGRIARIKSIKQM